MSTISFQTVEMLKSNANQSASCTPEVAGNSSNKKSKKPSRKLTKTLAKPKSEVSTVAIKTKIREIKKLHNTITHMQVNLDQKRAKYHNMIIAAGSDIENAVFNNRI